MTDIIHDWEKLAEPFPVSDIEWRIQQSGKTKDGKIYAMVLAYVTNRAIMQRLDDVIGPPNWRNEYHTGPDGGILCGISIRCGDEWVTKFDGADNTQVEAVKGGLSGAMKRAAVQWGIGRYLYSLEVDWADINVAGIHRARLSRDQGGDRFRWNPPKLPSWALPEVAQDKVVQKDRQGRVPRKAEVKTEPQQDEISESKQETVSKFGKPISAAQHKKLEATLKEFDLDRESLRQWAAMHMDGELLHLNELPMDLVSPLFDNDSERLRLWATVEHCISENESDRIRALDWVKKVSHEKIRHFLDLTPAIADRLVDNLMKAGKP